MKSSRAQRVKEAQASLRENPRMLKRGRLLKHLEIAEEYWSAEAFEGAVLELMGKYEVEMDSEYARKLLRWAVMGCVLVLELAIVISYIP